MNWAINVRIGCVCIYTNKLDLNHPDMSTTEVDEVTSCQRVNEAS